MTEEPLNTSLSTIEDGQQFVWMFIDDDELPFAAFAPPAKMVFDTTKLPDGKHRLRLVAQSDDGREGVTEIPFEVRNGPAISVVGLSDNDVVEELIPITVNAYRSNAGTRFIVRGSETPKAVPSWVWAGFIVFLGWAVYFLIHYAQENSYITSF